MNHNSEIDVLKFALYMIAGGNQATYEGVQVVAINNVQKTLPEVLAKNMEMWKEAPVLTPDPANFTIATDHPAWRRLMTEGMADLYIDFIDARAKLKVNTLPTVLHRAITNGDGGNVLSDAHAGRNLIKDAKLEANLLLRMADSPRYNYACTAYSNFWGFNPEDADLDALRQKNKELN